MAARRVGLHGHGDATNITEETSQNNTARGKAAAEEEGGVCGPAAGVQGRGPPLSLQVVLLAPLSRRGATVQSCHQLRRPSRPARCIFALGRGPDQISASSSPRAPSVFIRHETAHRYVASPSQRPRHRIALEVMRTASCKPVLFGCPLSENATKNGKGCNACTQRHRVCSSVARRRSPRAARMTRAAPHRRQVRWAPTSASPAPTTTSTSP